MAGAKDYNFKNITSFLGYNSANDKTNLDERFLVEGSQNVYKKINGNLAVRPGQKRQGASNSTLSACSSEFVWNTSWGATYILVVADSKLYVVIDKVWYVLLSSLTATRYVFDKWWDNTEKKDRALFVHGNSDIQHWSGGYTTVLSSTINTITKSGSTTWQQAGFASNTSGEKKIMIGGTEYTYTGGEATTTLTGVTPDASGIAVGATALQSVITTSNKPASGFNNDFIKIINNQVYVGSYTSRLCYISQNTDFTNYTVPTPRIPGSPEILTLDAPLKGIGIRLGAAHIGVGTSKWAVVTFNDVTVGSTLTQTTKVDVKPMSTLQGPYAHEFIDTVGDNLIYLAQDQQVRYYGGAADLFTPAYPSLSQQIYTELQAQNFTGGALRCIGDFTYVTAPVAGITYLYQVRQSLNDSGQVMSERLWHSPFIWNVTRVESLNGVVIGFSSANPQIYELWDTNQYYDDSPSDEELPYSCVAAFSYRTLPVRSLLLSFDKTYSEGYITEGTPLYLTVNYNYQGSTSVITTPINTENNQATLYTGENPASLGDSTIGSEPLGQGTVTDSFNALPKFKVIKSLSPVNCFEYQLVYSSDMANSRWELIASGTNEELEKETLPTFIINKQRNV